MQNHYQQYGTALKTYYALGLQNQFVDTEIRKKIPNSTAQSWKKNFSVSKVIGVELENTLSENTNELQTLYHPGSKVIRKTAVILSKCVILLQQTFGKKNIRSFFRNNKSQIINLIENNKQLFTYKIVGEIIQTSPKTLQHWKRQIKFKCDNSALLLCTKKHPNQATKNEIGVIKKFLSIPEYEHWGIHSIWATAFKQGVTNLAKQSWYNYNKLLEVRKSTRKGSKPKNTPSITSEFVNQIWHADITVFKAMDGVKYYIYTVMDNYSRYIHAWGIHTIVSAEIRLETIKEALKNAFSDEHPSESIQLVTDGGPENDNLTIKEFMNQNSSTIHHTIALRDIVQSNSMMEAFYKITKYGCLYRQTIADYEELFKIFSNWVQEYHFLKPHYALGIYTPAEVLNGSDKHEGFSERMKKAALDRRETNKNASCNQKCME